MFIRLYIKRLFQHFSPHLISIQLICTSCAITPDRRSVLGKKTETLLTLNSNIKKKKIDYCKLYLGKIPTSALKLKLGLTFITINCDYLFAILNIGMPIRIIYSIAWVWTHPTIITVNVYKL